MAGANLSHNKGYLQPTGVRYTQPRLSLLPLNQQVEWIQADFLDEWGKPIPNSGCTEILSAKINYYDNRFFLRQTLGHEIERFTMIHLRGGVPVKMGDIIRWWSTKNEPIDFHPVQIFFMYDLQGVPYLTKLMCK